MPAQVKNGGPPLGEKGTMAPSQYAGSVWGDSIWGAYDVFVTNTSGSPSEKQLQEMLDRDGKGEALEQVLTLPVRWAERAIEPADGDQGEAELVREALEMAPHEGGMTTPMDVVIAQLASAIVFRRSFFEKVFRLEDGRVTYQKLAWRPPSSCRVKRNQRDGSFEGFRQWVPEDVPGRDEDGFVSIGPEKALVYFHDQARAPLCGRSALETAYRAYEAKQKVRFLWFTFLERHATPWAEAKDESNDSQEADKLARKVATLKGGGVIGVAGQQSLVLHEPTSEGGAFKDCMDWLSAEMSVSVLASFTDLAQQGSGKGSFALSKDQSDFFLRACGARLGEIAATFTTYAVSDLVKWNFGNQGKTPTFTFKPLTDEAADHVRDLLTTLLPSVPTAGPSVPWLSGFVAELAEKVAAHVGVDPEKVREAMQQGPDTSPLGQVSQATDTAARLLAEAGVGAAPAGVAETPA